MRERRTNRGKGKLTDPLVGSKLEVTPLLVLSRLLTSHHLGDGLSLLHDVENRTSSERSLVRVGFSSILDDVVGGIDPGERFCFVPEEMG